MFERLNVLLSFVEKKIARPIVRARPWKISLEVSLSCNLRCITCSHGSSRFGGIMSDATFERVKPVLARARVVNEVGYGEPLLDPHFIEKLRYVKQRGATVCAYTNGMLLTQDLAEQLVALGLDQLTFSIDGATAETFESIRVGARHAAVLESIGRACEVKRSRRSRRPLLRANYVGMRRNIEELPAAVETLAGLGVQEVVLSDMMPPSAELSAEHLSHFPDETRRAIAAAREVAARRRVTFIAPNELLSIGAGPDVSTEGGESKALRADGPHAEADSDFFARHPCYEPWQSVYITADGAVRPCCAIQRPFGRIVDQDFATIWNNADYQALRATVNSRRPAFPECRTCLLRRRVRIPLGQLAALGVRSLRNWGVAQTAQKAVRYLTEYR